MALVQKQFGDLITFTRSSAGGRFNERGLFEMVPANQPRFDYDPFTRELKGLLIEEPRTNFVLNSNDVTLFARNAGASTQVSTEMSPDGVTPATEVQMPGGNTGSGVYRANNQTSLPGTYSIFVKPLTGNGVLRLTMEGSAYQGMGAGSVLFDLMRETFSPAGPAGEVRGGIKKLSGGWFRIHMSRSVSAGTGATNITFYAGDLEAKSFAVTWPQLENGIFPTSYIPTQASQVTRTADLPLINTLRPWYNNPESAIYTEFAPGEIGIGGTSVAFWFRSRENAANSLITTRRDGSQGGITSIMSDQSGVVRARLTVAAKTSPGDIVKSAFSLKLNYFSVSVNGSDVVRDNPQNVTPMAQPDYLALGSTGNGQQFLNGHLRAIRYYPRILMDSELKEMTK